jgi:hypothetical protein
MAYRVEAEKALHTRKSSGQGELSRLLRECIVRT